MIRRWLWCLLLFGLGLPCEASDDWPAVFGRMPLAPNVTRLDRTNCVRVMLHALQPNAEVKALVFMPGATDELYFFRRAHAVLTNASPSLLDAVAALTNQTHIRATFRPPLLLLHTDEDVLDVIATVTHQPTADRLRQLAFAPHELFDDRDWDAVLVSLTKLSGIRFDPKLKSADSRHFYRHSFAAWNLTGWEALEAIALAGKTKFTVRRRLVVFEPDSRYGAIPKLEQYPPP